jgi:hypothetical protein
VNEDYERYLVTSDAAQLAELRKAADEVDSFELGALAMRLGLFPPGYVEGERHSITLYGPPGHEGPPLLVWSVGLWSPEVDDEDDEEDNEGDDAWGGLGVAIAGGPDSGEDDDAVDGREARDGPQ